MGSSSLAFGLLSAISAGSFISDQVSSPIGLSSLQSLKTSTCSSTLLESCLPPVFSPVNFSPSFSLSFCIRAALSLTWSLLSNLPELVSSSSPSRSAHGWKTTSGWCFFFFFFLGGLSLPFPLVSSPSGASPCLRFFANLLMVSPSDGGIASPIFSDGTAPPSSGAFFGSSGNSDTTSVSSADVVELFFFFFVAFSLVFTLSFLCFFSLLGCLSLSIWASVSGTVSWVMWLSTLPSPSDFTTFPSFFPVFFFFILVTALIGVPISGLVCLVGVPVVGWASPLLSPTSAASGTAVSSVSGVSLRRRFPANGDSVVDTDDVFSLGRFLWLKSTLST